MQNYILETAFFFFFFNVADVALYWPHTQYAVLYGGRQEKKEDEKRSCRFCCLTEAKTSLVHRAGDPKQK